MAEEKKKLKKRALLWELIERFIRLNPDKDPMAIDWKRYADETLTLEENLRIFQEKYPCYEWIKEPEKMREDEEIHYKVESAITFLKQVAPEHAERIANLLKKLETEAIESINLKKQIAELQKKLGVKIKYVWFHPEFHIEFVGADGKEYRIDPPDLYRIPEEDAKRFEGEGKGEISVLSVHDRDDLLEAAFAFLRKMGVWLPEEFGDRFKKKIDYKKDIIYNVKIITEEAAKIYEEVVTVYGAPGAQRPSSDIYPKIPPAWATMRGKVEHLARAGFSVESIAEETGLTLEEVEKILRRAGAPIRYRIGKD